MTDAVWRISNGKAGNILFPALDVFVSIVGRIMPVSIGLLMAVSGVTQAAEVCRSQPEKVGVRYEQQLYDLNAGKKTSRVMELWRDGNRVLHVYPDRGLAEQWEHSGKGDLHLTVWFDHYAQGIEYMPEDIGARADAHRWEEKWKIVPDRLMQSLQFKTSRGSACEMMRTLVKDTSDRQVRLEWNVPLQLPVGYEVRTKGKREIWVAREIVTDPKQIGKVFNRRSGYKTTDFVDIGDNEDDPFLREMIHLGFVSDRASGFYDAEGNPLPGHEH